MNFGGVEENVVLREEFPLEKAREISLIYGFLMNFYTIIMHKCIESHLLAVLWGNGLLFPCAGGKICFVLA